jgi:kumamolisin
MADERTDDNRARRADAVAPDESIEFELVLRYRRAERQRVDAESKDLLAGRRPPPAAAADRSADPADIDTVRSFARSAGLTVRAIDPQSRRVALAGPAAAIEDAFGISIVRRAGDPPSSRDVEGRIGLPPALAPIVEAVLGLSTKAVATRG